ncbi:MAG: beta-lactamase class [Acidobacteriota bacterium]|jgi:beta-lactamase class A|nr:beta-lactamase class [Acidobacteriota bacterium]
MALALTAFGALAQAQTASTPATTAPTPQTVKTAPAWLDRRVRAEVTGFSGNVYLYAKNLDTGAVYSLGGDEPVRTASTIKVAIMVEAFARVAEGRAKWSDELVLNKSVRYAGSGVLQDLTDGLRLPLRDAVTLMMTVSDNTATNMVLEYLSTDAVNERMKSLGFKETRIMRKVGGGESREGKVEANKQYGLGRTSPHEMVTLLEKLERGEIVNAAVSKEMLDLMKREQGTDGIWRELWRIPKATKSGALDALRSNVGIIYHPRGRIALAVTCDDMPEPNWTSDNPAYHLMSRLSEIIIDGLGK